MKYCQSIFTVFFLNKKSRQGKPVLLRVGGKARILYQIRGILNFTSRSVKCQEILFLVSHEVWETIVSKHVFEGIDV